MPPLARRLQRQSQLSVGLRLLLGLALVVSFLMLAFTLDVFADFLKLRGSAHHALTWKIPGAVLPVGLVFLLFRSRKTDLCLSLQACTWIPLLHVGLLVFLQFVWIYACGARPRLVDMVPMAQVPLGSVAMLIGVLLLAATLWAGRRHAHALLGFLRPLTIYCLCLFLFLGLWLPIASDLFMVHEEWRFSTTQTLVFEEHFLWRVLLPPAFLASIVTASLQSEDSILLKRGMKELCIMLLGVLFTISVSIRGTTWWSIDLLAYANFLPVLLCIALVTMFTLIATGACYWRLLRRGAQRIQSVQEGVVICRRNEGCAGWVHYLGWLQGLRVQTSDFTLRTNKGDIPIPAGAQLIAPLPLWTTRAKPGESKSLLRSGDRVRVSGLVLPTGENAYRSSSLPTAGTNGIVVVKEQEEQGHYWREITLACWRPVVLYLFVSALVALSGLAVYFAR